MTDASFASLSSTLLARKGGAKPAMRPQSTIAGPVDGASAAANLDDLGWNDMGEGAAVIAAAARATDPANQYRFAEVVTIGAQSDEPAEVRNDVHESIDRIAKTLDHEDGNEPAPADKADAGADTKSVEQPKVSQLHIVESDEEAEHKPELRHQARDESEPAPKPKAVMRSMRRAAFTLRLDQQRHLMLKLACTVKGCSAQQLVSDALDEVLSEMPEIASLAAQVKREPN